MTRKEALQFLDQLAQLTATGQEAARIRAVINLFKQGVTQGALEAGEEMEDEVQFLRGEIEEARTSTDRVFDHLDWLETRILRNEQDEAVILMDRIRKDIAHA